MRLPSRLVAVGLTLAGVALLGGVVLVAAPEAAGAPECEFTVTWSSPSSLTERASAKVSGRAAPGALIEVRGGPLPAESIADRVTGEFAVEVPLRSSTHYELVATLSDGRACLEHRFGVTQSGQIGFATVSGRLVDAATGEPVPGARISYRDPGVVSGPDGRFTIEEVPSGSVLLDVEAPGYLPSLAEADLGDAFTYDLGDVRLEPLAASVTVTPEDGATLSGPFWTIEIPAEAVLAPTPVTVTTMQGTQSPADARIGLPLLDITVPGEPDGFVFRKPVRVTVDAAALGLDPSLVPVEGFDPSIGFRTGGFATSVAGDDVTFEATFIHGMELRIPWELLDKTNQFGDYPADECKPFTGQLAPLRVSQARGLLDFALPKLMWGIPEALRLYRLYLTPGRTPSSGARERVEGRDREAFVRDQAALAAFDELSVRLEGVIIADPPALGPPTQPTTREIQLLDPDAGELKIDYQVKFPLNAASLLAGGIGDADIDGAALPDRRTVSGQVRLVPAADGRGVLTQVRVERVGWTLKVLDTVDFCPGNLGGPAARLATLAMSRLEKTPTASGGTEAAPVPFEVDADIPDELLQPASDLLFLYGNDPDEDGWPDSQPWIGGTYALDNCPGMRNPDQGDSDGDGIGDACDCVEEVRNDKGYCPDYVPPPIEPDSLRLRESPSDPRAGGA